MNIILYDSPQIWQSMLPLTFAKPISALRVGILTIAEKWQKYFAQHLPNISCLSQDYLNVKFPAQYLEDNLFINSSILPNWELSQAIENLNSNEKLVQGELIIASKGKTLASQVKKSIEYKGALRMLQNSWDIYALNGLELRQDFELITKNRVSCAIDDMHTVVYGKENVFIEEGVIVRAAILNALDGPIYLGKNSEVQEGAIIRGAFALCNNAVVNMGSKMRGDTTIGPFSKVGGEVSNSVLQGYSNKAHDGFLGNAVLGDWCNLGADTNCSNLKNNYSEVEVYSYLNHKYIKTGRLFSGLIMGDHCKAGINTMFNTGTVVGFSSNIFGGGFPPKYIPSFSWCSINESTTYKLEKAIEVAKNMYARRNMVLSDDDISIFEYLFKNR